MNLVTCSGCQQSLQAPDRLAGKQVRCPKCQHVISIPSLQQLAPPPALSSTEDLMSGMDTANSPLTSESADGTFGQTANFQQPAMLPTSQHAASKPVESTNPFEKVNTGINLVLICIIISFVSTVVGMLMSFLSSSPDGVVAVISKLNSLAGLVASVFGFVGLIYCLNVPERTKAKPFVIAALSCVATKALLGEVLMISVSLFGIGAIYLIMFAGLLTMVLSFAVPLLFLLFLRTVAEFTKQQGAVDELDFLVKLIFFMLIGGFVGSFVASLIPFGGFILVLAILGAEGFWMVRFIALLKDLEFRKEKRSFR